MRPPSKISKNASPARGSAAAEGGLTTFLRSNKQECTHSSLSLKTDKEQQRGTKKLQRVNKWNFEETIGSRLRRPGNLLERCTSLLQNPNPSWKEPIVSIAILMILLQMQKEYLQMKQRSMANVWTSISRKFPREFLTEARRTQLHNFKIKYHPKILQIRK